MMNNLSKISRAVSQKVRELRIQRRLTQKELAAQLGLSQSRLSEIEQGKGSFTAEQFIMILKIFNIPMGDFGIEPVEDSSTALQNALARLGAKNLVENSQLIPDEQLEEISVAIREALLSSSPRLLTALGPVLIANIEHLHLEHLFQGLKTTRLQRRLAWVVENIYEALGMILQRTLVRKYRRRFRRTELLLSQFLDQAYDQLIEDGDQSCGGAEDIVDRDIRSARTRQEVSASRSEVSRRWGILSALEPADFEAVIRAIYDD